LPCARSTIHFSTRMLSLMLGPASRPDTERIAYDCS
jgi:hypothetical protein